MYRLKISYKYIYFYFLWNFIALSLPEFSGCVSIIVDTEQVLITTLNVARWLCSFPVEILSSWQMLSSFMSCPEYAPVSCSAFGRQSANYGTCLIARLASILIGPVMPRPHERRGDAPIFHPPPSIVLLVIAFPPLPAVPAVPAVPAFPAPAPAPAAHSTSEMRVIVRLCFCLCLRSHQLAPGTPRAIILNLLPFGKVCCEWGRGDNFQLAQDGF